MPTVIHLRTETKPFERRSPLSPKSAKALLDAGYIVRVEKSADRVYRDEEFSEVGAELIEAGSWESAPEEDIILGLKELPENDKPLKKHEFIHFQHIFKGQTGSKEWLQKLNKGNAKLYDLEFLVDENGRRVSAFGYWAGFAGSGLALWTWAHQILNPDAAQPSVPLFDDAQQFVEAIRKDLQPAIEQNGGKWPRALVMGALGRCGKGAAELFNSVGLPAENILKWDMAESAKGGPFTEIAESDIFVNCVYLGPNKLPPFVTAQSLSEPGRRLRTVCDVSCDPNSENNPVPIYNDWTTFDKPTITPSVKIDGPEIRIIAIDHLPTLVPRESSDEFSAGLLPSLLNLDKRATDGVWTRAEKVYNDRVAEATA